jgi:hypothetical protein
MIRASSEIVEAALGFVTASRPGNGVVLPLGDWSDGNVIENQFIEGTTIHFSDFSGAATDMAKRFNGRRCLRGIVKPHHFVDVGGLPGFSPSLQEGCWRVICGGRIGGTEQDDREKGRRECEIHCRHPLFWSEVGQRTFEVTGLAGQRSSRWHT